MSDIDPLFAKVVKAFAGKRDVTRQSAKGFGSGALKVNGKIFAMMSKAEFVVKLPRLRVDQIIAAGQGTRFDPGHGIVMREWVVVTVTEGEWVELGKEAYRFVKGQQKKTGPRGQGEIRN